MHQLHNVKPQCASRLSLFIRPWVNLYNCCIVPTTLTSQCMHEPSRLLILLLHLPSLDFEVYKTRQLGAGPLKKFEKYEIRLKYMYSYKKNGCYTYQRQNGYYLYLDQTISDTEYILFIQILYNCKNIQTYIKISFEFNIIKVSKLD